MFTIMMGILPPLAKFLISQQLPKPYEKHVAAPCFNYYDFCGGRPLQKLLDEMQIALDAYLDITDETPNLVTVNDFSPQLEALLPIQNAMTTLVNLDDFTIIAKPVVRTSRGGPQNTAQRGTGPLVLGTR